MPHLRLEYSTNVILPDTPGPLLARIQNIVASEGGIDSGNMKSRAIQCDHFIVGTDKNGAFVHLQVSILTGRKAVVVSRIGTRCLDMLRSELLVPNQGVDLQLTVEIRDIDPGRYFKYPFGTLQDNLPDALPETLPDPPTRS